jgi:hypothetical protein
MCRFDGQESPEKDIRPVDGPVRYLVPFEKLNDRRTGEPRAACDYRRILKLACNNADLTSETDI